MGQSRLWKVLNADLTPMAGAAKFTYQRGKWAKHLDPSALCPCAHGYHYCRGEQIAEWLPSPKDGIVLAEVENCPQHKLIRGRSKEVTCRLRVVRYWTLTRAEQAGLFAATGEWPRSYPTNATVYRRLLRLLDGKKPTWETKRKVADETGNRH
jgi:hypothetical protein